MLITHYIIIMIYSSENKIYHKKTPFKLVKIDIIWKTRKSYNCYRYFSFILLGSYLGFVMCNTVIIFKDIINNNYFKISLPLNLNMLMKSTHIIDNNIILRSCANRNGLCKSVIYNIKNRQVKIYDCKTPYKRILKISTYDGHKIILLTGKYNDQKGKVIIGNTIEECLLQLNITENEIASKLSYFEILSKTKHELLCISGSLFTVTNNNFEMKYSFAINFWSRDCCVAIYKDIIYVWNEFKIAIVTGTIVNEINNNYNLRTYNDRYHVFVNNKYKLFKIEDNKIIKYIHKYDWWNDLDKPQNIENIILTIIELTLFPADIINLVYQQYVKVM